MRAIVALAAVLASAAAAPASASTLDYLDETYRFQGTEARDVLSVTDADGGVTFTDVEGTLTIVGELPAGCEAVAANSVRCTQPPSKKTLMDAGGGDDELLGSRFEEYMLGGDGNDRLRPGLGADHAAGGTGHDTMDLSRDGRTAGVNVSLGTGPDSGDSMDASFERYIGTRHADSFILIDPRTAHEIETLGGADYVDTADSYGARSPGDRLECGPGVDLYRASYTDEDVIGCEAAGGGLGRPVAGHLQVTYGARHLPGRILQFVGSAECAAGGQKCVLEISVQGFGTTVRRIRPGEGAALNHHFTRREYARAQAKARAVRPTFFTLSKPGFPSEQARVGRDIAP